MTVYRDPEKLILCSATLLPDPIAPKPGELAMQIRAAYKAGFAGISLWGMHEAFEQSSGQSSAQTREDVEAANISVPIVETIMPWDASSPKHAAEQARDSFESWRFFGSDIIAAVSITDQAIPEQKAVDHLRAVCDLAQEYKLTVATEFLPWSGIATLDAVANILTKLNYDNAGIVLDAWHWQRQPGGPCADVLRDLQPQQLAVFQLCDAAPKPQGDPMVECMQNRLLPGDGVVDLAEILAIFDQLGASPIVAPEVFNQTQTRLGGEQMAANIFRSASAVLAAQ